MATNTELKATLAALVAMLPDDMKDYGTKLQKRLQKAIDTGDSMTKDAIKVELQARIEHLAADKAISTLSGFLKLIK
jgi:hypothetical protein